MTDETDETDKTCLSATGLCGTSAHSIANTNVMVRRMVFFKRMRFFYYINQLYVSLL